ncbi:excisionase family DNA-binding protein [Microtetraspora malaysiensis]|uniref:excisionase family DNA-binding protein n=1 Tax=Microtetraspora malaysiensis TaxID=161358 RepID=UPI003D8E882B
MNRRTQREGATLPDITTDRLLTVDEVAERLSTSVRFPRRLIEERRITFVRIGRNVRIPESALNAFIRAGVVEPIVKRRGRAA